MLKESLPEGTGQPRGLHPGLCQEYVWPGFGLSVQWLGSISVIEQDCPLPSSERGTIDWGRKSATLILIRDKFGKEIAGCSVNVRRGQSWLKWCPALRPGRACSQALWNVLVNDRQPREKFNCERLWHL